MPIVMPVILTILFDPAGQKCLFILAGQFGHYLLGSTIRCACLSNGQPLTNASNQVTTDYYLTWGYHFNVDTF
jgi:hypothetical protein